MCVRLVAGVRDFDGRRRLQRYGCGHDRRSGGHEPLQEGRPSEDVELKPGMQYMMALTIKAGKSETARVFFKTG